MANVLRFDRQVEDASLLTEAASVRAVERLTVIHRDTIMRLGLRIGSGCAVIHDTMMRNLQVPRIELDETWSSSARSRSSSSRKTAT